MPYHVICENCGQLLYSAAPIPDQDCPQCGSELPETRPGSPPPPGPAADADEPLVSRAARQAFSA
ncbi:hypothetical protein BH20ACT18_BH20ACT18_05420 [soil metagenome]